MKILHLNQTAGIPQIISKYVEKLGITSKVLARKNPNSAKFGFGTIYPTKYVSKGPKCLIIKAAIKIEGNRATIIHIHGSNDLLRITRAMFPEKPIIITYHGGDIRNTWDIKKKFWSKSNIIIVATKDLLKGSPDQAIFTPNPIDTEHWKRKKQFTPGTSLFCHCDNLGGGYTHSKSLEIAKKHSKKQAFNLTIQNRTTDLITYEKYPRFVENFEYLYDIKEFWKTKQIIEESSTLGLQALALGLKVFCVREGKLIKQTEFPKEHDPNRIAKIWKIIYEELLENEKSIHLWSSQKWNNIINETA